MKKVWISLSVLLVLLLTTGCGSSKSDSSTSTSSSSDSSSSSAVEVSTQETVDLTYDYFIPENIEATYYFRTTGENVESIDKDGFNFEVTWKEIDVNKYESTTLAYFDKFIDIYEVEDDKISWVSGQDLYGESEIYESSILEGQCKEFSLKSIDDSWTNVYVLESKSIETETFQMEEEYEVLGIEKIQILEEEKEAIKVVSKIEDTTTEKWYVKGLGLVKMVTITSGDKEETELLSVN